MRFEVLDSFRGLAAVAVIAAHIRPFMHPVFLPTAADVYLLVDFFFLLSGFVICFVYGARLNSAAQVQDYAIRRIGRIWPLHLAMLAVMLVAAVVNLLLMRSGGGGVERLQTKYFVVSDLIEQIFLLNSLHLTRLSWNIPSWSIGAEMFAYVAFAALVVLKWARVPVFLAIIVATLVLIMLLSDENMAVTSDYGVLRCAYSFFAGAVICRVHERFGHLLRLGPVLASVAELGVLVLAVVFMVRAESSVLSYAAPLVFSLVVLVFAHEAGLLSKLLKRPFFLMLGRVSYSIYLLHFVLLVLLSMAYSPFEGVLQPIVNAVPYASDLATAGFVVLVVLLSMVTYRFIELPGQRFAAKIANSRRAALAPIAA
ncbi:MAG: acyltransferase [Chloroflexi bacterium]|nr:acyltransferase [Chloroflexota bacterium]